MKTFSGSSGDPQSLYFGGDMNAAIALSGQVAGRISEIRPIRDVINDTIHEFSDTVKRLSRN